MAEEARVDYRWRVVVHSRGKVVKFTNNEFDSKERACEFATRFNKYFSNLKAFVFMEGFLVRGI